MRPTVLRSVLVTCVLGGLAASSRVVHALPAKAPSSDALACLRELGRRNVNIVPLRKSVGVRVPVRIEGAIGRVSYRPTTVYPLVVDCRFALALTEIAPVLRQNGVRAVEFSNSHTYRKTDFGRLSLHANGLALDVHSVRLDDGTELSVQDDFSRRLGARGCGFGAPALNRLACGLRATGLFSELLTPDYNRQHRDHFHLAIARGSTWVAVISAPKLRAAERFRA
jgi:hypothetical protein